MKGGVREYLLDSIFFFLPLLSENLRTFSVAYVRMSVKAMLQEVSEAIVRAANKSSKR